MFGIKYLGNATGELDYYKQLTDTVKNIKAEN